MFSRFNVSYHIYWVNKSLTSPVPPGDIDSCMKPAPQKYSKKNLTYEPI